MVSKNMKMREYARQAKKRLQTGYWQKVEKDRQKYIDKYYQEGDDVEQLSYMFQQIIAREIHDSIKPKTKEDEFYKKVVKLLSENEYVLNPIMRLIDHDVYDGLSEVAKQNYIYELTDKYNEMKQRYEEEKKSKAVFNC